MENQLILGRDSMRLWFVCFTSLFIYPSVVFRKQLVAHWSVACPSQCCKTMGGTPRVLSNPLPCRKLQMCCSVMLNRSVKDYKVSILLFLGFVRLLRLRLHDSDSVCGHRCIKFNTCPSTYCSIDNIPLGEMGGRTMRSCFQKMTHVKPILHPNVS